MTARRPAPRARRTAGFTLVELMVGLALGMLILLALVTLVANVSRNNAEMARTTSVIENGRSALQVLEQDVALAGFWGGWVPQFEDLSLGTTAPTDAPATALDNAVPDPCLAYASWDAAYRRKLVGIPVQVHEIPSSGVPPVCGGTGQPLAGAAGTPRGDNHLLVVRHAAPCPAVTTATDPDCLAAASQEYFQVGRCGATMATTFAQSTAATLANFTQQGRDCTTVAPVYRYVSNLYYVRNWAFAAGDGIPTLVKSTFSGTAHGTPQALVEGIEAFRVELGIDNVSKSGAALTAADFSSALAWQDSSRLVTPTNRGDGIPDQFQACTTASPCTAFDQMNVVTARLYVLVRAQSPTPGYNANGRQYVLGSKVITDPNDGFKRHVYTRTVRLHNVAMRREVPPGA